MSVTSGSESGSATMPVVVTGQQKIGHFTMSFVDMTIPVAGMPVQVVRTYDSRDPRVKDFGAGWSLSYSDVRVEVTRPLATEWLAVQHAGGPGSWGWSDICVEETRPHVVSVTFPDGRVVRFRPEFSRNRWALSVSTLSA